MIELQVLGGCQADGPCEQGTLGGEGFHVVTEVNVKDQSVYDDTAFSPQLIDKETGLPFMESIMTKFPTMDFTCPFCNAPTKVNGVTNMNGVAIETETAREMSMEPEESKETMGEAEPWDEPAVEEETSMADQLLGETEGEAPLDDVLEEEDEITLEEDDDPDDINDLFEDEDESLPFENDVDLDEPLI
jgi:hypothetical protein